MTDARTIRRLRWTAGILLVLTFVVVLWMGGSATSFALSNGVGDVACRPVLAPNTVTSLIGESEVPQEAVEQWLVEVGFADTAADLTAEDLDAANAKAAELCVDARSSRSAWMTLVGVIGLALSAAAILLAQPRSRPNAG
jgi:hypothetical protein